MAKKNAESAQIVLFQKIKSALPSNVSFVDELADILKISNDSAYRRIRGDTALTIEEIALLCNKFKFSFDSFINANDSGLVNFSYSPLSNNLSTYKEYLQRINSDLVRISSAKEKEIIYAGVDMPLFHNFVTKELAAFKIFYWNKAILDSIEFTNKQYSYDLIDDELIELTGSIYDKYASIPSVEIWSDDTLNSTLKQIEFCWDSGIFKSKEDALVICHQIHLLLERLNTQAETGKKMSRDGNKIVSENNFKLYHSDVMIGSSCILVTLEGIRAAYILYHTFNALSTISSNFCNETELWLENLVKKSNLISGVGEKQRYRFFNYNEHFLKKLISKIESGHIINVFITLCSLFITNPSLDFDLSCVF